MRQQIVVRFTERIVDLDQYRADRTARGVADPEAHRVEDVAQHSRKRVQHDLVRCWQPFAGEDSAQPCFERRAVARPVIAIVERHESAAIPRDPGRRQCGNLRQRQAQAERRISKGVHGGARAPVRDLAADDGERMEIRISSWQRRDGGGRKTDVHEWGSTLRRPRARVAW